MANPLSETSTTSLNLLFSRDPESYTRQDLDEIIAELRRMRTKWRQDEMAEKKPRAAKAPKAPAGPTEKLSTDDLLGLLGG